MTEKSRQEERSHLIKGSASPQMQAGLMPHPFGLPAESSLALPTPHPLAYGIMHQSLNVGGLGRVPPNVSNDLGPPIFMPSLNLGVPRQQTTIVSHQNLSSKPPNSSLTQPPIMSTSFMSEVMPPFSPQPLIFHPSQIRQPQPSYLTTVNMKQGGPPKGGTTKASVSKGGGDLVQSRSGVVRPTPKPASLPTSHTKPVVTRPNVESPVEQLTYVPTPGQLTRGPYVIGHPMQTQKGSTLSKMLMSPAQQQTTTTGQEMGGAYVSHNTTLRSAVPALASIASGSHSGSQNMGNFTSAVPDGYSAHSPISDHVTPPTLATSGQPTSTASFVDTKTERPPQPSASIPPSSQPLPPVGVANKDRNIIIRESGLTGRHIAAITNNPTPGGGNYAYTQSSVPQTVDGHAIKNEYGAMSPDTGWIQPAPDSPMATGNLGQLFDNFIQQSGKLVQPGGGVVVPTATAPGALGLPTHTHSPGGSNLIGSPVRQSGVPNPQSIGTSPRPQILRKRALESSLSQGDFPPVPLSPTSEGGVACHNHVGGINDVSVSPRKKPRKQNVVANDDQYASNVPDSLSSSSSSSLDTTVSAEGSEESGRSLVVNSAPVKTSRVKGESLNHKDGGSDLCEVEVRYLSQLRRCPFPISSVYKVCHKAPHNHFRQHSDIKHRDDVLPSAVQVASDKYVHQRAEGWRVHHIQTQLEEMSCVERDLLEQVELLRSMAEGMLNNQLCHIDKDYVENFIELTECNAVRSARILSQIDDTKTQSIQILDHQRHVSELLDKCSPRPPPHLPLFSNHHKTRS